jgi:hypothetical protein
MLPNGHPGVYIQEIPSTPTIVGAPTAIPLFMGVTELTTGSTPSLMGEPDVPYLITSWASYTRYFGGLVWGAYTAWAVYEFFQEGGGTCYVVSLSAQDTGTLASVALDCLTFSPTTYGPWADFINVAIRDAVPLPAGATPPSSFFTVSVMVDKLAVDAAAADGSAPDAQLAAQVISAYIRSNRLTAEPDPTGDATKAYVTLETFGSFTVASLSSGSGNTSSSSSSSSTGGGSASALVPPIQSFIN